MSDQYTVVSNTSEGVNSRLLFAGTQEDAAQYIVDHFPRVHVEPGSLYGEDGPPADAALIAPGGSLRDNKGVAYWNGAKWSDWSDGDTTAKSEGVNADA